MNDPLDPEQATKALADIHTRQRQVIDAVSVPAWYWWTVAALMVVLGVIVDSGRPVVIGIGATVFAVVVAGATAWMIAGRGQAQVGRDLLGESGAIRIVGFVALIVGVSLAVGFTLQASGVHHAATVTTLVAAIGVAGGGPRLMRSLRRTMLEHRAVEGR